MTLPAPAQARAASAGSWLVGATPGAAARTIAARFGAHELVAGFGAYDVPTANARAFADALRARGLLSYAEADDTESRTMAAARPIAADALAVAAAAGQPSWRGQIVADGLVPPPLSAQTRPLVLIDTQADPTLPGFAGGHVSTTGKARATLKSSHGTATLAVAAAPDTGTGMQGVWPGMTAVNIPTNLECGDRVVRLGQAIALRPAAINMSYGSLSFCYAEYVAMQRAVKAGIVLVAAAGNEFFDGNPAEYPASLPHVLTIGALAPNLTSSYFSNESAAIDLAAPGEDILTIVPPKYDKDGNKDGLTTLSGTSFAAPMVAAAVTWVRSARPDLTDDQVAQLVRLTARDIGKKGWDSSTGFGLLNIKAALAATPPAPDPLEPNDDLPFVNGKIFGKPAVSVVNLKTRSTKFAALVDRFEDPNDLYRMVIPARTKLSLVATPAFGDIDLELYGAGATTVEKGAHRLAASRNRGSKITERLTYTNRSRRPISVYARVYIDASVNTLDSRYTLSAKLG